MSAAMPLSRRHDTTQGSLHGLVLTARHPDQAALLPERVLEVLVALHRRFEPRRQSLLEARRQRQQRYDAGELPGFRDDTRDLRERPWKVAPLPPTLQDRRVEITGPVDPKTVINALNSGANCYMADFEDATSPTWDNLLTGQQALRGAVAGTLEHDAPETGRQYRLRPRGEQALLMVRPRGWHLDEKHLLIDGAPVSAGLFDAALYLLHNARALVDQDRVPCLYLPKLESMEEAALWDEVLASLEASLGLPEGTVRTTVLIETLPAAFQLDEILYALRSRAAGLNCGRWDYIFSYLKVFRAHPDRVLPERGQVGMDQPFLRTYSELLVHACHRRGVHAMGGMAAQIPVPGDAQANEQALAQVRADKLREAIAGHDGTWVAHPALIPVARGVFDERMPGPHQHHVARDDIAAFSEAQLAAMLAEPPRGTITRAGFDDNVEVCVRYLAAWLAGTGCVPIHHLMEDAATAEIARAQLWQWLHHPRHGGGPLEFDDGTPIDFHLLEGALLSLPYRLHGERIPGADRVAEAIGLLDRLCHAEVLPDFLTVPAYARLD